MRRFAIVASAWCAVVGLCTPQNAAIAAVPAPDGAGKPDFKFVSGPEARMDGGVVRIDFEANRAVDVAVEIQDGEGNVVRHLAAGLLGPNAPEPLQQDRLDQSLVWDRKDDSGKPVAGQCRARVGLGLTPRFDRVMGWHPLSRLGSIEALAVNGQGEVYLMAGGGILVLDANGRYLRQLLPASGQVAPEMSTLLHPVRMIDGGIVYSEASELRLRSTGMALSKDGGVFVVTGYNGARKVVKISRDGCLEAQSYKWLIHPKSDVGVIKVALSADEQWLYVAGQMWGHDDSAVGRKGGVQQIVTRLNLAADQAGEVFLGENENAGAGSGRVNSPKAAATDANGNVYVADFGNNRVGVWDSEARFVREIVVPSPQEVYVHPRSGQIFVLSGPEKTIPRWEGNYFWQSATLLKFSPEGRELAKLELAPPFIQKKSGETRPKFTLTGALDFSGAQARVFVASSGGDWLLVRVDDKGGQFAAPVNLLKDSPQALQGVRYVTLDRQRDEVYVRDQGLWSLWRFDGASGKGGPLPSWKVPRTGRSIRGSEMSFGPDGLLYISAWHDNWDTSVLRYNRDGNPVAFKAVGSNEIMQKGMFEGSSGQRRKGICAGQDGKLYVLYAESEKLDVPQSAWDATSLKTCAVDVYDLDGNLLKKRLIAHLRAGGSCVRADRRGNVYVGDNIKPVGYAYPTELAKALLDPFKRSCVYMDDNGGIDRLLCDYGCVVKFPPTGGRIAGLETRTEAAAPPPVNNLWSPVPEVQWFPWQRRQMRITGALWQYLGISRMPAQIWAATAGQSCVCSASAFDLDEHARLYVPDSLAGRIKVLDRNGNLITAFGAREHGRPRARDPVCPVARRGRQFQSRLHRRQRECPRRAGESRLPGGGDG